MSGFECSCGEIHHLFSQGGGEELASDLGVPLVASIPLDVHVVPGGDEGMPVVLGDPGSAGAIAFTKTAETLVALVPPADMETCTGRIAKMLAELDAQPV
jgi:ATP-binding protein involved in chromosome partitioning